MLRSRATPLWSHPEATRCPSRPYGTAPQPTPILLRAASRGTALITVPGTVASLRHAHHIVDGLVIDGQYGADRAVKVTSDADFNVLRHLEVRRS